MGSKGSSQLRDRTLVSSIYLHWQESSLPLVPPGKPRDDSSTVLLHCFLFLIEFIFDNLYFPKIVHFICFLNLSSRRIEPMFVLSTVVSFASAKTMQQASSKYLLCESMCVCVCVGVVVVDYFGKKEGRINFSPNCDSFFFRPPLVFSHSKHS